MELALRIIGLSAAVFIALVVHECGHLVAARLAGFRFWFLAIGPMWLCRSSSGLTIEWRWSPASWAPMAGAWPRTGNRYVARAVWYIAGGPLANLAVAIIAFTVSEFAHGGASVAFRAMALASTMILVATAQPLLGTGVGVASDGRRLVEFIVNRERAKDEAAAMTVYGLGREGLDPGAELVERAARVTWTELPTALRPPV